jgi:hypothetical protein
MATSWIHARWPTSSPTVSSDAASTIWSSGFSSMLVIIDRPSAE